MKTRDKLLEELDEELEELDFEKDYSEKYSDNDIIETCEGDLEKLDEQQYVADERAIINELEKEKRLDIYRNKRQRIIDALEALETEQDKL